MPYTYASRVHRYRDTATGRLVSWQTVSESLYASLDVAREDAAEAARRLIAAGPAGSPGFSAALADYEADMLRLTKNSALTSTALGKGGWAQMGQDDYGRVGRFLWNPNATSRDDENYGQYGFLRDRVQAVKDGTQALDGTLVSRSEAYVEISRKLYDRTLTAEMAERGFDEERTLLDAASEHCTSGDRPGCVDEAAREWVPSGTLAPIGGRTCLARCRCTKEFRNSTTGATSNMTHHAPSTLSTNGRALPEGVQNGTYALRPTSEGALTIEVREFVGWWETEQSNFVARVTEAEPESILLRVSSEGGFLSDALAIRDFLKGLDVPVAVEITGTTASAATIIADAGDDIRMSDNALYLPHYARFGTMVWGTVEDNEEAFDQSLRAHRKFNERIVNIYQKRTGKTAEELDPLLKSDEWLTPEEALEWGFIDSVFEPGVASAQPAATAYAPSPQRLQALGLPALPSGYRPQSSSNKPEPKPMATKPDPQPKTAPEPVIPADDAQGNTGADIKALRDEMRQLKAENARLAEDRRTANAAALQVAFAGKIPGVAVEALVEAVAVADKALATAGTERLSFTKPIAGAAGSESTITERMTTIASTLPDLVTAHPLEISLGDGHDAEAAAKVVRAM